MNNVQDSSNPESFKNESLKHESFTPKPILLITDHSSKDIIFNTLKTLPFISQIRIGSLNMAPQMTEINYIPYDCIIYDLKNCANIDAKDKEIEQYIKNDGGYILISHDVFDGNAIGPLHLFGLEHCPNFPMKETNKTSVCSTTNLIHDYLVVNEIGLGRTAYWVAGHSNTIYEDEKKIICKYCCLAS